jgi:16S rRNA (uracil1498-N3)-methyltransferase
LFLDIPYVVDNLTPLSPEHTHYLIHVMRAGIGDPVRIFNGRDGEWLACVEQAPKNKKNPAILRLKEQRLPQREEPDIWLCAAPIKRQHFDYLVMKASELGVRRIQPVITDRTQVREVNIERLRTIAIEAAEQSERMGIPEISEAAPLKKVIETWPKKRLALLCAEFGEAQILRDALMGQLAQSRESAAIFTGPEGGFTQEELTLLQTLPESLSLQLGPRILRADTAAIGALSCWQALCGDWREERKSER